MNLEDALTLIRSIRYKPTWRIEAMHRPDRLGVIEVTFVISTEDANITQFEKPRPIKLGGGVAIADYYYMDDRDLLLKVYTAIHAMETHECKEWFRIDGKQIYPTHQSHAIEDLISDRKHEG